MESLWQDCRYAARILIKNPGFTVVAVLVLALGIGANAATFTLTNSLLLRPIVAEDPDELVALYNRSTERPDSYRAFSYPNFRDIRELATSFDGMFAHDLTAVGVREGEITRRAFADIVSPGYFETLGVEPFRGRFFTEAEARPGSEIPVVVASHAFWRRHGADPDLVGEALQINGRPVTVVGIAPPNFSGRTALLSPVLYLPMGMHDAMMNDMFTDEDRPITDREAHRVMVVGRLKAGVSLEEANARLDTVAARLGEAYPAINEDYTITAGELSRMSISTSPSDDSGVGLAAVVLMAMTGIVLLIACIDLANMLLARGATRSKEFAIRAAIGGQRGRILRQLLTEGLMLSLLGGAAGLLVAVWANRLLAASLNHFLTMSGFGMDFVLRTVPDVRVLLATVAFCVFGTLLFGLGPALKQSRPDVMEDLKDQAGTAGGGTRRLLAGRNLLVVGQVALSVVLLVAAGLFIRAATEAAGVDPGIDLEHGLLVETDPSLVGYDEPRSRELYRRLQERLAALPGIESASVAATVPFGSVSMGESVSRAGELSGSGADGDDVESVGASSNIVGADYFETMGIPVVQGRGFTMAETHSDDGPGVAVIDSVLAERLWPEESPVGRRVRVGGREPGEGRELEVVGVVGTVQDNLFSTEARAHLYVPFGQQFQAAMNFHLRAATADREAQAGLLQTVRETIRAVDSQIPVLTLRTLRTHLEESASFWLVGLGARIFSAIGALALTLAVVGVYGVKAYTVARRTREIGIRKALGASESSTLALVLREGAALTGIGLGVGLLMAAGVGRVLSSMLYEVGALDPVAFLVAPLVLAAAALVATYVPARRAARVDPMTALRSE